MHLRRTSLPRGANISLVVVICSAWIGLAGCQSAPKAAPPPLAAPLTTATVTHHAGSPLARPSTRPIDPAVANDALAIQVRWTALEHIPGSLATVAPNARLIAIPSSTQPIAASGKLVGAVRLVQPSATDAFIADVESGKFGRTAEIATVRGALPVDVAAVFDLSDSPDAPNRRRVELAVYRAPGASNGSADQMQLGLSIIDPPRRERALLDPMPLGTGTKLGLVLPSHFGGTDSRVTLAVIDISRQTVPEHAQALAQCIKELSSPVPATQPAATPPDWSGLAAALHTLTAQPDVARPAMIFLADQTNATLCGDIALVADDATLASLSKRITSKTATPASMDKPALGWILDSACFEELAAMQAEEKMPPELSAVLTNYAGEAGRHASSLDGVAKESRSREQLDARLLAENLVYLEDASPAARVRAFDWLAAKNHAPAGYDPLGPNKQRRDALDKAIPASATQAPGGVK